MQIDLDVIRKDRIETTSGAKKMTISPNGMKMMFEIFSKGIYSNPIGTVVREITSNCFDSHKEAGVNMPVLVKKTYDETTDTYYASFIDYGVGIAPDRMDNIYSVYFESTKRSTNDEIGGFGIGAKSPLAYRRSTGHGEGEYDNSFYVITNYEGKRYYYTIYMGSECPEYTLMHQEKTDERNGTEVRIPMLQRDVTKFEDELIRQLYYFENIVFEGWNERVENDYQIVRGKTFLHRGNRVDEYLHVCLGRVYYPLDFDLLGLSRYDYNIPVAINVPIGKVHPVVSREKLDYSEGTISYLKKRVEEVMSELKKMLANQYANITSLEDYFQIKEDFGVLQLTDNHSLKLKGLIKQSDLDYSKYRYNALKTGESAVLFELFFDTKMYGKRIPKRYSYSDDYEQFGHSYPSLKNVSNVVCTTDPNFKAKRVKNAYLRDKHGRFYMVRKSNLIHKTAKLYETFKIHFDTEVDFHKSPTWKEILEMQEEYMSIVQKYGQVYEDIVVPDDYQVSYKQKNTLSKDVLKKTIPVKLQRYTKERVYIKDLVNFRGKIFYAETDLEHEAQNCREIFNTLFKNNNLAGSYSQYYAKNRGTGFDKNDSLLIITMAKNNLKYMEYCKNAYPLSMFWHKMVRRKENAVRNHFCNQDVKENFNNLDDFYKGSIFASMSKTWAGKVEKVRAFVDTLPRASWEITSRKNWFSRYMDVDASKQTPEEKIVRKHLKKLIELEEMNRDVLRYVKTPERGYRIVSDELDAEMIPKILKNVLYL